MTILYWESCEESIVPVKSISANPSLFAVGLGDYAKINTVNGAVGNIEEKVGVDCLCLP